LHGQSQSLRLEVVGKSTCFGSTATGARHAGSDIDLAVRGCPPHAFFQLLGQLLSDLEHPVDLVDLDLPGPFVEALLSSETLVHLG